MPPSPGADPVVTDRRPSPNTATSSAAHRPAPTGTPVWDAPVRLFHWALVLLIGGSYACARLGWMRLHFLSGYTILVALLFRLAWGIVGSDTARFGRFVASPAAALRHLGRFFRRESDATIGHNAAGGWMVLAMLLLLAAQVGTGLFANDDVISNGPLYAYAGKPLSDRITGWHIWLFNVLLAAIALHIAAIAAYWLLRGQDLLLPMLSGRKLLPAGVPAPRLASAWLALALFVAAVGAVAVAFG